MTARAPETDEELDSLLSEPGERTVRAVAAAPGDIVVLGAGGKMGPTLARMAKRAATRADGHPRRRVIAVSRFSSPAAADGLNTAGVETIQCDLQDRAAVALLPDAPNVVFMAGQKFGTRDDPSRTWMLNVVVPALCAERYAASRIVAFSTGNVYPLVPVAGGGAAETDATAPIGEYAATSVGRERMFEHVASSRGTRVAVVRLNYANALRYGVLTDLAMSIRANRPIPLAMGSVNVIWQGDANRTALELLPLAAAPPLVVNVTGTVSLRVRDIATSLARRMGCVPRFSGVEAKDALLSDTTRMRSLVGEPEMRLETMLDWVAAWVVAGRPLLGKPTHFEARDGAF